MERYRAIGKATEYPDLELAIEENGEQRVVTFRDPRRAFAEGYCADNADAIAYPIQPDSLATRLASFRRRPEYN